MCNVQMFIINAAYTYICIYIYSVVTHNNNYIGGSRMHTHGRMGGLIV